jgi:uncharacterized protein YggE
MNRTRIALALAGLLVLLSAACDNGDTVINSQPGASGVTVEGTGRAVGTPDVVVLTMGVDVEQPTVEAARDAAARAQDGVLQSLRGNGVAEKDIQTVQFSVQPVYDFVQTGPGQPGRQTIRGYRVTNQVRVEIRQIAQAGKIIDDATRAGGNQVTMRGINFTIADPAELQKAAREEAVRDARERAEELARHSGVSLGELVSIMEVSGARPVIQSAIPRAPATGEASTPIQSGELEVVVQVSAVWSIE